MTTQTDVLIIGAGPTGLTLANLLGMEGINTTLIEARDELIDFPRAVGIDDEALRAMQTIGLVNEVLPHTIPDQKVRLVNGDMTVIGEIDPRMRIFGWPRRNGFVQPLVDRVLLDGLKRFPSVSVHMSTEAIDMRHNDDSVSLTVKDPSGATREISARYLVGAEGGRSFVRGKLGIGFPGHTRPNRGLVVDVANDPLGLPHAVFGGDPSRGYATLGLPHGIRRWEFTLFEHESDEVVEQRGFVETLMAAHVDDPSKLDIIRSRVYAHHARVAERFRDGRCFIAGDAAHVMPVVAGQGWNSCIRDALNLGWKLAAVIRGSAGAALLDTYEAERRPHAAAIVNMSRTMAHTMVDHNRLRSAARDAAAAVARRVPALKAKISNQGFKPLPRYESNAVLASSPPSSKSIPAGELKTRSAGELFPQPRVIGADGETRLLDDVTGQGWRVLTWNNDPHVLLTEKRREQLARCGARLVHVVPATQLPWAVTHSSDGVVVVGDVDGTLRGWFDERPYAAVVIRPDHVIALEETTQRLDRRLASLFDAIDAPA